MALTLDDLTELIRYHLVVSAPSDAIAFANLSSLCQRINSMSVTILGGWLACDHCGCTVHVDVLANDGSNWTVDGDFLCSSCLRPDGDD